MARRWPAEWEPQSGVLVIWPHHNSDWADSLPEVENVFARLVTEIARDEPVLLVCFDRDTREAAGLRLLEARCDLENVYRAEFHSNDTWARDFGPFTVVDEDGPRLLDFRFDGWGGKYQHELDDIIPTRLAAAGAFQAALSSLDWVLEGGSVESDGRGTLFATRRSLLESGRNAFDETELRRRLELALGVERVVLLANGWLAGDDTDGHIDNLVRVAGPDTLLHAVCDDTSDPHYEPLTALADELAALSTSDGEAYTLVPLPLPAPVTSLTDRRRLPASYCNFLVTNHAVLVPTFDDPNDELALTRIAECFPDRRVAGIASRWLLEQNGALHCLTMQLGAGVLNTERAWTPAV